MKNKFMLSVLFGIWWKTVYRKIAGADKFKLSFSEFRFESEWKRFDIPFRIFRKP